MQGLCDIMIPDVCGGGVVVNNGMQSTEKYISLCTTLHFKKKLETLNSKYTGQARASTAHIKNYAIGEMQPSPPTSGLCISTGGIHLVNMQYS